MAGIGLHEPHEGAVAVPGAADQAAGAGIAEVVPRQVVAAMLIDTEQPGVRRVAVAAVILVGVAEHGDRRDLHQRLVVVVQPDAPGLVLAEGDARGALGVHGRARPASRRLGGAFPGAREHRHAVDHADQAAQVVEAVGRVVVGRAVRVHALDIDDVEAVGMARDEFAAREHRAHDAAGEIVAGLERPRRRIGERSGDIGRDRAPEGDADRAAGLAERPARDRPQHTVGRRLDEAEHREPLLDLAWR